MSIRVFLDNNIAGMIASTPKLMIITCAKLISCGPKHQSIDDAAVIVRRGIIEAVGAFANISKRHPGQDVARLENAVLMPGLVNAHAHLEIPPLLDTIRAETFSDWVINLIREKKNLSRKDYRFTSETNIDVLIKTGTTTVGEICTHGVSSELLKRDRLRAIIFQEIISMNPASPLPDVRSFPHHRSPVIRHGISPHTPYTVSEEALQKIKKISKRNRLPLCMHIAESKDEIKLLQRKKSGLEKLYHFAKCDPAWAPEGFSSFEYLNRIGFLSPNLLAVHAVQVDDYDIGLVKKSGLSIAHCPRSNKQLGVGKMPLKKFLAAGVAIGLGTDSLASSPTLNMWDEMRYAYQIHRRDGVSAEDIFRIATIGGAKALGLDKEIGTIEPGKKADIIAVPLPSKNTGDIYSDLLRETKSCIMTMVNGKILYLDADFRR